MNLPSMIKGWLNPQAVPEKLLLNYYQTLEHQYLAVLVEQFNRPIFHYLVTLSDQELAQDVLQSMWLKVISGAKDSRKESLPAPSNVKSWLYTIARNTLIDELRRQQRWQWQPVADGDIQSEPLDITLLTDDRLQRFNMALQQLPYRQKEALIFQHEGFSLVEIAKLTNEKAETVKSRIRYAKKHLTKLLGNTDER